MKHNSKNGAVAQGAEAPVKEVTPDMIREWTKRDIGSAIVFLQAILSEEAVLNEIVEIFETRMKQRVEHKAKEGQI